MGQCQTSRHTCCMKTCRRVARMSGLVALTCPDCNVWQVDYLYDREQLAQLEAAAQAMLAEHQGSPECRRSRLRLVT